MINCRKPQEERRRRYQSTGSRYYYVLSITINHSRMLREDHKVDAGHIILIAGHIILIF